MLANPPRPNTLRCRDPTTEEEPMPNAHETLVEAAQQGNRSVAEEALKRGADANYKDEHGKSVLSWAVGNGHVEVARLLLENGADPNTKGMFGPPLVMAASNGFVEIVRALLQHGAALVDDAAILAKINDRKEVLEILEAEKARRDAEAATQTPAAAQEPEIPALVLAAASGDLASARRAIQEKCDVDARDPQGATALLWAVDKGHSDLIRFLIDVGADVRAKDQDGWTPLAVAASKGQTVWAGILLGKGAEIEAQTSKGRTPLIEAVRPGHTETVELLLDHGANPNHAEGEGGWTSLMLAAGAGRLPLVDRLLARKADVAALSKRGWTALAFAAKHGHADVAARLLDRGAAVDPRDQHGGTPLLAACGEGRIDVARLLLDRGADVHARETEIGATPLVAAAIGGHGTVLSLLLERGADPNAATDDGLTALTFAAHQGHRDAVVALLAKGARVDAVNRHGETALLRAAGHGRIDVAALLLDAGANPDIRTKRDGLTPLMAAADGGHTEVVRLLLERGADRNVRTLGLRTAWDYARFKGHRDTEALLKPPARPLPPVRRNPDATPEAAAKATRDLRDAIYADDLARAVAALEAGAELDPADRDAPLILAAAQGTRDLVELLLREGADPEALDPTGLTALAKACGGCHVDIVELLLARGAKVNRDVLMAASIHGRPEILQLLEQHGKE